MNEDRAKSLIAALLATEGRTPDEIEAARKQAAKLMVKFDLTEEEVLREDRDMATWSREVGRHQWLVARYIATAIEELTCTRYFYQSVQASTGGRSDRKRTTFMGYRPDVEQAEWLMDTIIHAANQAVSGAKNDKERSDLMTGFAIVVQCRILDLAAEVNKGRAAVPTGTDLVVVKMSLVDDYMTEQGIKLQDGRGRGRGVQDRLAFLKGMEAGSKVSLSKPIGTGPLAIAK